MKNQSKFLIFFAVVLAAIYAYRFTDWFAQKEIQIKYRTRPGEPIMFYLDKEYQVTSLKVISLADAATNKYPHDLWHLVADGKPAPVTDFFYGGVVPGMKPKIAGLAPEPLQLGADYRIVLESPKIKGEKVFQLRANAK
jgi:hypothetical protein